MTKGTALGWTRRPTMEEIERDTIASTQVRREPFGNVGKNPVTTKPDPFNCTRGTNISTITFTTD